MRQWIDCPDCQQGTLHRHHVVACGCCVDQNGTPIQRCDDHQRLYNVLHARPAPTELRRLADP